VYDTVVLTPDPSDRPFQMRRRLFTLLGMGSAVAGTLLGAPRAASAQGTGPKKHEIDDWMDALPSAHRMVFDALSGEHIDDVLGYASNVFLANRSAYGLENTDVGVIVILRHHATPFAFTDAVWAKYGSILAPEMKLSTTAPDKNPMLGGGEGLDALSGQGVHFGVCQMATRRFAGGVARKNGGTADALFTEFSTNLVRNAHLTPAGIVAVGRAQERGYAFGYAG
jgi:hypothetical protein